MSFDNGIQIGSKLLKHLLELLKYQQMHFCFVDVILLHCGHQHVSATRGHLKGGKNKNTNIIQDDEHKNT
jgi:hypothetical protein